MITDFNNSIKLFLTILISIDIGTNIILILKKNINKNTNNDHKNITQKFIDNFDYVSYENFTITEKMEKNAGWMHMSSNQYYFINGIIRKHKPKNCLEIGIAEGGSSILILNAIKDIKDSKLVSLDLKTNFYLNGSYKTGYRVKRYFPELTKNWKLLTGEQPHIFLDKLQMKFDFLFLDTAHINPGEIINIIEVLPFLNKNAIIVVHDIIWHFIKEDESRKIRSISSPNLLLMSVLHGYKKIIEYNNDIDNMGAIFLYEDQKKYYLDYFLLLLNFWEYIPSEKQIAELRTFIKKYYVNSLYSLIFEKAIKNNKNYVDKLKKYIK